MPAVQRSASHRAGFGRGPREFPIHLFIHRETLIHLKSLNETSVSFVIPSFNPTYREQLGLVVVDLYYFADL